MATVSWCMTVTMVNVYKICILLLLQWVVLSLSDDNVGSFSFASYYSDHMVLQQAPKSAQIWGYSSHLGDEVTIEAISDRIKHKVKTKVEIGALGKGIWRALLPPIQESNDTFSIVVTSKMGQISISDVLFGDVWICSGQSNMHFLLNEVFNASYELQDSSNYPAIRVMSVTDVQSKTPLYDLNSTDLSWSLPNSNTLDGSTYFSAVCWLYGKYLYQKLNHPIGLIASSWGATLVETWSSPDAQAKCGKPYKYHPIPGFPREPYVLWNSMIHPLLNMTIYGAIFYQGESNSPNPAGYACSFPAMIDDWRVKFNKGSGGQTSLQFPFGFVQVGPSNNQSIQFGLNQIRWSQTAYYGYTPNKRMKNVFMAVAMDLTDLDSPRASVHFRDKQTVSKRLVLSALAVAYNKQGIKFQGPYPSHITHGDVDSTLTIQYDHGQTLLDVRGSHGFEVCCVDNHQTTEKCQLPNFWFPAPVVSSTLHSVTLRYTTGACQKGVGRPFAVRYAWRQTPCAYKGCSVYSQVNQLPAPTFRIVLNNTQQTIIG